MPGRANIADVAREAGVSMMTVSRVINNKAGVCHETRQAVENVILKLDYHPNKFGRALATQHTGILGLVVADISNPFFSGVAQGVQEAAFEKGYSVLVCNTGEDPACELEVLEQLLETWVDGLVLCSSRLNQQKLKSMLAQYPAAVLVNHQLENMHPPLSVGCAFIDDRAGGRMAAGHLIKSGHKEIGFLSGPTVSQSSRWRLEGYQQALVEARLPYRPELVLPCVPTVEGGQHAAAQMLSAHPDITAIFCFNDLVAVGTAQTCKKLGRSIPDDLAIVGYDDTILAPLVTPPLTTCRVAREHLGQLAAGLLLDRLGGCTEGCTSCVIQPELIIRASAP